MSEAAKALYIPPRFVRIGESFNVLKIYYLPYRLARMGSQSVRLCGDNLARSMPCVQNLKTRQCGNFHLPHWSTSIPAYVSENAFVGHARVGEVQA